LFPKLEDQLNLYDTSVKFKTDEKRQLAQVFLKTCYPDCPKLAETFNAQFPQENKGEFSKNYRQAIKARKKG
jgi:hypothetical protein